MTKSKKRVELKEEVPLQPRRNEYWKEKLKKYWQKKGNNREVDYSMKIDCTIASKSRPKLKKKEETNERKDKFSEVKKSWDDGTRDVCLLTKEQWRIRKEYICEEHEEENASVTNKMRENLIGYENGIDGRKILEEWDWNRLGTTWKEKIEEEYFIVILFATSFDFWHMPTVTVLFNDEVWIGNPMRIELSTQ